MATFKIEIQNKRADGTYNIRIRVIHNGEVRRISSNLYASASDLTKGGKIKNAVLLEQANLLLNRCIQACNRFGFEIQNLSVAQLSEKLKNTLSGNNGFTLDFREPLKTFYISPIVFWKFFLRPFNEGTVVCYFPSYLYFIDIHIFNCFICSRQDIIIP
jgi:hypothetical protein